MPAPKKVVPRLDWIVSLTNKSNASSNNKQCLPMLCRPRTLSNTDTFAVPLSYTPNFPMRSAASLKDFGTFANATLQSSANCTCAVDKSKIDATVARERYFLFAESLANSICLRASCRSMSTRACHSLDATNSCVNNFVNSAGENMFGSPGSANLPIALVSGNLWIHIHVALTAVITVTC